VNPLNLDPSTANRTDPVSGFAAIPRNMTGIATKLAAAGYKTHAFGKWDAGMGTVDHTPHGRGYQSNTIYFHHANDYWSSVAGMCKMTPPPGPPAPCRKEYLPNFCLGGAPNLGNETFVATASDCCALCSTTNGCEAWA